MRRYLIIGSGAAGISAAEAVRHRDPGGEIILVCEEKSSYYSRPGLAYYLTGELTEKFLFPFSEKDFSNLALKRIFGRAVQIHQSSHQVELGSGQRLPYDRLLIATGSTALLPAVPGINLQGVVKLDSLDDACGILKQARKTRQAVVVGGGITALELVEGLAARHVRTTYFLRGKRYWNSVLDETESSIVEHRLQEEGVTISYNTEMVELVGRAGRLEGVRTQDGRIFSCQMAAIAIGVRPRLEIISRAQLQVDRGILVNEYLQTSDPDIFAAGDVAQVFDPHTGKTVLDTLWGPARDQGKAAGANMAGLSTPYRKLAAFNVTRLAGLTTTIIGSVGGGQDKDLVGIARGDSETWRKKTDAIAAQENFAVNRIRILIGLETLHGAVVMGDQTLSIPLQQLIAQQVDICPIREQLLHPRCQLSEVITNFWSEWKSTHAKNPQE